MEMPEGRLETCRVYILCDNPGLLEANQETTALPSETYIKVIISGANESGLPEKYIRWLQSVKHNGRHAIPELVQALKDHLNSVSDGHKNDKASSPPRSPADSGVSEN